MIALVFIAAWSAKSAWTLQDRAGVSFGTTIGGQAALEGARERANGAFALGGRPNAAFHYGFGFGLELSAGARADVFLLYNFGVSLLVLGVKQAVYRDAELAVALRADWSPYTLSLISSTEVNAEVVVSKRLSDRWDVDAAAGASVGATWGRTFHQVGPRARVGFAHNPKRFTTAFGIEAAVPFNMHRFGQPVPFPYVLAQWLELGVYVSLAYR